MTDVNMTRRGALVAALPVAATAVLPVLGASAALADGSRPDAALLALEPRLAELHERFLAALHEFSVAEVAFYSERKRYEPRTATDWRSTSTLEGLDAFLKRQSVLREAYAAEENRLRAKYHVDEAEALANARGAEFMAILWQMADTPATTFAGLAFKIRWADHEDDSEVRDSIYLDIERLTAGERAA